MKFVALLTASIFCLGGLFVGCQPSGSGDSAAKTTSSESHGHGHDHDHEHPESLKEALGILSDLYAKIKTAFESGDPDAAHGELHEVGHLLEDDFPSLINKDDSIDSDSKAKLETIVSSLFDEFFKLDDMMHGGGKVEFSTVETAISASMDDLKALLP